MAKAPRQTSRTSQTTRPDRSDAALLDLVRRFVLEIHGSERDSPPVLLDSRFGHDLGLDSLSRLELLTRAEKLLDSTFSETILNRIETPRDLLREAMGAIGRSGAIPGARDTTLADLAPATTRVPGVAAPQPIAARTLVDVLLWHADQTPDRIHIRLLHCGPEEVTITYGELLAGATQVAQALIAAGLEGRETVIIMLPTGRDYFFTFFGVLLAGAIPVPVYPPGNVRQIEEHLRRHSAIIANAGAAMMVTTAEATAFTRLLQIQAPHLRRVLIAEALHGAAAAVPPPGNLPELSPLDIAFIQYTSGSTGLPKGVVLTHANLLANVRAMGKAVAVTAGDVFVSWLPLYHDMGLIGAWFGSLYHACPLVLMPPLAFISHPERWPIAIHRYGGTLSAAPNFAYELCLRRIGDDELAGIDLSTWRCAFNGAEAVRPATLARFIARFAPYGFKAEAMMPVYGLAECSVGLAFPPLGQVPVIDRVRRGDFMTRGQAEPTDRPEEEIAFVNCGRPLPGHEIRIVDQGGRELPDRVEGNLQFRGPSATSGYYRNSLKTGELFAGPWLNSGDRAYMAAGAVYLTGRAKDIVIRAGRNIYPEDLEEAIGAVAGIRKGNVAVFGVTSESTGTERLVVLAETRKKDPAGRQEISQAITAIVTDRTGGPPDEIVLAPPNTVPKTSSGKIRRTASREYFVKGVLTAGTRPSWWQIARFALSGMIPILGRAGNALAEWTYSFALWSAGVLAAPVLWLAAVVLPTPRLSWRVIGTLIRLLAWCGGIRIRTEGLEQLPPSATSCVIVANHASYLDALLLAAVLPRPLTFIAKAELARFWLLRLPLARLGTIFVDRFDMEKGIAQIRRLRETGLGHGKTIVFFAEGTFTRAAGLLPFRLGAFETAVAAGLPLVPLALRGTRQALRADSWFLRRHPLSVTVGPVIATASPDREGGEDLWQTALAARDQTRSWILAHCGEPDLGHEQPLKYVGSM